MSDLEEHVKVKLSELERRDAQFTLLDRRELSPGLVTKTIHGITLELTRDLRVFDYFWILPASSHFTVEEDGVEVGHVRFGSDGKSIEFGFGYDPMGARLWRTTATELWKLAEIANEEHQAAIDAAFAKGELRQRRSEPTPVDLNPISHSCVDQPFKPCPACVHGHYIQGQERKQREEEARKKAEQERKQKEEELRAAGFFKRMVYRLVSKNR